MVVSIDAGPMQDYHSGVDSPKCGSGPADLDHSVLLVGYGVDTYDTLYLSTYPFLLLSLLSSSWASLFHSYSLLNYRILSYFLFPFPYPLLSTLLPSLLTTILIYFLSLFSLSLPLSLSLSSHSLSDNGGTEFWKIKNSWADDWGEDGYYRLVRGKNKCGVAEDCVHSIVKHKRSSSTSNNNDVVLEMDEETASALRGAAPWYMNME